MAWTITYDMYCGFLIKVREQEAGAGFGYQIFKLKQSCVRSGKGLGSVEAALERARQKIDDELADRYDIELNRTGEAELKSFLMKNVKNFAPNDDDQFSEYVGKITDAKRDAGADSDGVMEIVLSGDYGDVATFTAPDDYFQIVDNGEK
ncbi:hypothetical protein [Bartonella apis]|uniref:hypothetical protein n=1 Tax=Bartonella apis TaxID=1686310 RepID=UPI0024328EFA|nr:hypothetical protein [Bartonella apis]